MMRLLRQLPRTVWLVGLISLLNDAASDLVYPLLPLYLATVVGSGPRVLGLIEGLAEATASLLKLVSGVVVDRTARTRPWIIAGYGVAGLSRPLIALTTAWPAVLVLRMTDRLGKGLRSAPRDLLLAGSVDPARRGLAFGVHRAMDNAGAVIGPLIAAALLARGTALPTIFAYTIVPAVLCLVLTMGLREPPARPTLPATRLPRGRLGELPPAFRRYLAVVALFSLGNASNMFLLWRAAELGVPTARVPLLWAWMSAVTMVGVGPLTALSDRWGRQRLLVSGYLAYGIVYLLLGRLTHGGVSLVLLFGLYGMVLAATEGVERAVVADLVDPPRRGSAYGWFHLTTGVTLLPASIVFGWLYQAVSPASAFAVAGGCAIASALLLRGWARLPRAIH
jgi:MFS family permease